VDTDCIPRVHEALDVLNLTMTITISSLEQMNAALQLPYKLRMYSPKHTQSNPDPSTLRSSSIF
jgi:hypothetical protein